MPQRRQQDPRRTGQLAQYHPGGGDLRSRGRSQGPLTGDPSVTAPTEQTAPAQESPLFAGGPGEPPPQLARLERSGGVADTPLAGEGLMAPGFGGDTDMQARPAPTEGGGPTSVRSDPGLQAPIPPPIPEPIPDRADPDRRFHRFPGRQAGPPRHPENVVEVDYVPGYGPAPEPPGPPSPPWMPEGAAPPPREVSNGSRWRPAPPPPPPGPPRPQGPRIDWMPGDPGYDPDEGRGLRPPGDSVSPLDRMLGDIRERELALQHLGSMDQLRPIDQTVTARPDLRQLMPLDRPDLAGWAPVGEAPPPWVPPGWSPQGRQVEEERRRTEVPPERRLLGRQRRRIGDY